MRWVLIGLLVILLVGCDRVQDDGLPVEGNIECSSDDDCVAGGCSGTICQPKDAEPIITTCEWREEFACYKEINCGCIDGRCQWEKTKSFDACIDEKKGSGLVVV